MEVLEAMNSPVRAAVWPEGKRPLPSEADGNFPAITFYMPSIECRTGQSVLLLPGGGYHMVSLPNEGHRPAQWLCSQGIAAAVLEYRHHPQQFPVPLLDAQRGLRLLRQKAIEFELDPNQVGTMGFSAGGHLAGLLALHEELPEGKVADSADALSCHPDFAALIYPVILLTEEIRGNIMSKDALLGNNAPLERQQALSINYMVRPQMPPVFVAHGQFDGCVPVQDSVRLYQAMLAAGAPCELHLYPDFPHGIGLGFRHAWADALRSWLDKYPGKKPPSQNG